MTGWLRYCFFIPARPIRTVRPASVKFHSVGTELKLSAACASKRTVSEGSRSRSQSPVAGSGLLRILPSEDALLQQFHCKRERIHAPLRLHPIQLHGVPRTFPHPSAERDALRDSGLPGYWQKDGSDRFRVFAFQQRLRDCCQRTSNGTFEKSVAGCDNAYRLVEIEQGIGKS